MKNNEYPRKHERGSSPRPQTDSHYTDKVSRRRSIKTKPESMDRTNEESGGQSETGSQELS